MSLFVVMDGHGDDGHRVSAFIKNNIVINMENAYERYYSHLIQGINNKE